MNPPISGQYMAVNIYEAAGQACSETCSLGDGNAQATCSRRSCLNTKRS
jgi:hypothetical protein